MPAIRAIPTFHNGYHFRSRLEARWAVAFDVLEIRYDYEPEGFVLQDGSTYLPDFWLPQVSMYAEVKPSDTEDRLVIPREAIAKAALLAMGSGYPVLFLDGIPRDTNYWAIWPDAMDPIGWDWVDVDLFDDNAYHRSAGRFWTSTGTPVLEHVWLAYDRHPAILSARSERFDRGAR